MEKGAPFNQNWQRRPPFPLKHRRQRTYVEELAEARVPLHVQRVHLVRVVAGQTEVRVRTDGGAAVDALVELKSGKE